MKLSNHCLLVGPIQNTGRAGSLNLEHQRDPVSSHLKRCWVCIKSVYFNKEICNNQQSKAGHYGTTYKHYYQPTAEWIVKEESIQADDVCSLSWKSWDCVSQFRHDEKHSVFRFPQLLTIVMRLTCSVLILNICSII